MRILIDQFSKHFGNVKAVDRMDLEIRDGEMLALLGPSGCGKTTTLFAICGIHRIDGGRILFGDRDVAGVSPQERNVGVVFQSYALYPHMPVFDNIAFPLRVRKESVADVKRKVSDIADLLHIGALLERRPNELSGGQQQRVALARALIRRPHVLLLDEPLANLDAKLRLEMRSEIRRIQLETGITAVLVTHDQVEAMSMCDRIALMDTGRLVQVATPVDMYRSPANAFAAGFLGNPPIVFLDGKVRGGRFHLDGADMSVPLVASAAALADGTAVKLGVRPEHVQPEGGAPINGTIAFIETQGRENLYDLRLGDGSILRSIQPARDDIQVGDAVTWAIDTSHLLVFDGNGECL